MVVVTALPWDREWTADDLAALPDDGLRYELVDGVLLVSAAPVNRHQYVVSELFLVLHQAAPRALRVLVGPVGFRISARRELQPDLVVVTAQEAGRGSCLEEPPLLVVEVLWPSTRTTDATLKRAVYEAAGVASYWLVDVDEPSLTVLELSTDHYREVAVIRGNEAFDALRPFPVRVVPADLVP